MIAPKLHGVIDDDALERMRLETEAKRAALLERMGRKHLLHPANRIAKTAFTPLLSQPALPVEVPAVYPRLIRLQK